MTLSTPSPSSAPRERAAKPRERAIMMRAADVLALIAGRKTQHRVPLREQPYTFASPRAAAIARRDGTPEVDDKIGWKCGATARTLEEVAGYCPFGRVGDRLWVREKYRRSITREGIQCVEYAADSAGRVMLLEDHGEGDPCGLLGTCEPYVDPDVSWPWLASVVMPRWASRLTLTITDARCERVQSISVDDVWAEGVRRCVYRHGAKPHIAFCDDGPEGFVPCNVMPEGGLVYAPVAAFATLWDERDPPNGCGWGMNPFVWCLTFTLESEARS